MAAITARRQTSEFVEIALSFVQRLVHLEMLREGEERSMTRRMRALLVDDFLTRVDVSEDLRMRLLDQGLDLGQTWRVLVLRDVDPSSGIGPDPDTMESYELKMRVCVAAETHLREHGAGAISLVKSDELLMLVVLKDAGPEATRRLLADTRLAVSAETGWQTVGVGSSAPNVGDANPATALRQAQLAASGSAQRGNVVLFEDMGGGFRLLAGHSEEALSAIAQRFITPLADHDRTTTRSCC